MEKKTYIQILLLIISLTLVLLTLYIFLFNKSDEIKKEATEKILLNKTNSSNLIESIEYSSNDAAGNKYEIFAQSGEISIDNPNIIYMKDVNAVIYMKNSAPIYIKSDFADYNSKNYDTFFKKNILLTHLEHKMTGERLNLLFQINLVRMYKNIIYKNINTTLYADKLEIDLITKNSKIFMDNKSDKIQILVN
jgi:hypothetical protein